MVESIYRVVKPRKNFQIIDCDGEIAEESLNIENLSRKIFENPDIIEAYELGNLHFSDNLSDGDKAEIVNEVNELIAQEKNALVAELDRDN